MKKDFSKGSIIAVDFDGTLCEDKWPNIGDPYNFIINGLINLRTEAGCKIILWTCREGKLLEDALDWCKERGLEFDAVNDNVPESSEKYGGNSRKIYADLYVDDKSFEINLRG